VVFAAVAISLGSWLLSSGPWGGLINIDAAEPLSATFQVDLNNADWPELTQLPEVGETLAKRIIESREQEGPFESTDALARVRGIGPKTLEKIQPFLRPRIAARVTAFAKPGRVTHQAR
jgi:competence protein ComEA